MMMSLGNFVFGLNSLAYDQLQRQTEWRHGSTSRIGTNPAHQFLGRGEDTITLPGTLYPALAGSPQSLNELRLMADTGKAFALVEGTGRVYGAWFIESLSETRTFLFQDGAPRKIEFTLSLKRLDEAQVDTVESNLAPVNNLLRTFL